MRHNLVVAQYAEYVMVTGAARATAGERLANGRDPAQKRPKSLVKHEDS
jgi:hypothetical protein